MMKRISSSSQEGHVIPWGFSAFNIHLSLGASTHLIITVVLVTSLIEAGLEKSAF